MGISGLWDAVAPDGKIIHPKNLENKIMAIDGSFWIRCISASRENGRYDSDFISIFFKRICKLLSYKIIPIIVFDGIAPDAKRNEINHRLQSMSKYSDKNRRLTLKRIAKQALFKQLFNGNKDIPQIDNNDNTNNVHIDTTDSKNTLFDDSDSSSCTSIDYEELISGNKFNEMSPIDKFNYLKSIQQKSFNDDRTQLVDFSGSISEFSDKLLSIYMKNANVNKLLDKVKLELNIKNIPQLDKDLQLTDSDNNIHNVWLDSNDIIKDYNTLIPNINNSKKRKFLNDLEAINDSDKFIHVNVNKLSSDIDEDIVTFNNDADLFGDEFISDQNIKNSSPIKYTNDNSHSSSDEWEETHNIANTNGTNIDNLTLNNYIDNSHIDTELINTSTKLENVELSSDGIDKLDSTINDTIEHSTNSSNHNNSYSILDDELFGYNMMSYLHNNNEYINQNNESVQPISPIQSVPYKLVNSEEFDNICALLKLFKIQIIFAPSEAEAQCAQLSMEESVYGVISDDSDTLAFGALRVVKNFFNRQKNLELYQSDTIKQTLGLTREKLTLIGILCGCDYTNGIKGIGIVNALEIIEAYPTFNDLYEFRDWATNICSNTDDSCDVRRRYKIKHEKSRNGWIFNVDFPNIHAYNLLMSPKVDLNIDIKINKNNQLDKECIESIALFMKEKSKLIPDDIITHLNELNRCTNNNILNGQLRLYDIDGIKSHIKFSSNTPDQTVMTGDDNITVAYIRSERMKSSIKGLKSKF